MVLKEQTLKKNIWSLTLLIIILGIIVCACGMSGSREEKEVQNDNWQLDSFEPVELLDYITLPQEKVMKKLDLVSLDEEVEEINVLKQSAYRGTVETADFFIHFSQGEIENIWLPVKTDALSGICSLAGCDMTMTRDEAAELFSRECQYIDYSNMYFSSLRLEKMGILELNLACNGNGDLSIIAVEVSSEKIDQYKNLEYIWTDKMVSFLDEKNNVEMQIVVPQVEIMTDTVLAQNLNSIFMQGIYEKLSQCGWNVDEMNQWQNIKISINYEKTFESAEYISIHYTGSVVTDKEEWDLNFGTTCYTSNGGGMTGLSQIFNDEIFDKYENDRIDYRIWPEDEEAIASFLNKEQHYTDYYLMPSRLILLGTVESANAYRDIVGNDMEYDTVSLLRDETVWNWDYFRYNNEDNQVNVLICAPQIEVQLQEELKRNINILIGQVIFEKLQSYGLEFGKIGEWKNTEISIDGVCTFASENYRSFAFEGKITSGIKRYDLQFGITVCMDGNGKIVLLEDLLNEIGAPNNLNVSDDIVDYYIMPDKLVYIGEKTYNSEYMNYKADEYEVRTDALD